MYQKSYSFKPGSMRSYFFIDSGKQSHVKVCFSDINYIEACRNYVRIVTTAGLCMVLLTMRQLEQLLPLDKYSRIHRAYIVSIDFIQSFNTYKVFIQDKVSPIGIRDSKALRKKITIVVNDYYDVKTINPDILETANLRNIN